MQAVERSGGILLHRSIAFAAMPLVSMLAVLAASCAQSTSSITPVPEAAVRQPPAAEQGTAAQPTAKLKRICIVENARVLGDFLEAYRRALSASGYEVQVFPRTPPASLCPLTTRYVAYWKWDFGMYLEYAELRVYRDGQPAGRAEYRARSSRVTDAEPTLTKLIDQLLPK